MTEAHYILHPDRPQLGAFFLVLAGLGAAACTDSGEPFQPPPPEATWRQGPELPAPVVGGKAVMIDGIVFVADGVPYGDGKELYRLKGPDDDWVRIADLPEVRRGYALVGYRDSLFVIGGTGFVPGRGMVPQTSVFVYSIAHDTWTSGVPMPEARVNHGAVLVNDRIVVVGGSGESAPAAAVAIYDPATGRWSAGAPLPTQRVHPKVEAVNGTAFVFGGWKPGVTGYASELELISAVEAYDLAADTWRTATSLPSIRLRFGTVRVGNEIHVIGGYEPILQPSGTTVVEPVNRHETYNTVTGAWTVQEPGITPRFDLALATLDNALLAIGGVRGVTVMNLVELRPLTPTF